jgi:hypothetical protein
MNIQTDVGLQLLGYRLLQSRYRPSETLEVMLYWRALRPLPANYRVRVYLRDAARSLDWLEQPLRDPAGFPTRRWITSGYVKDSYQLNLPQDIFAGNYQIALEAYSCDSQCTGTNRLTFFNPADREPEKLILLPTVITIAAS